MPYFTTENIGITGMVAAVPPQVVSAHQYIPMFGEEAVNKFIGSTGIEQRRVALPEQTASDLGVAAAEELLTKKDIDRSKIGVMVFVTQSPDYRRPSTGCVVHYRLGLPVDCAAIEINLGCSGFIYGLQTAMSMLQSSDKDMALLVLGETATKITNEKDRSVAMMFGDAGAAVLLEKNIKGKIQISLKTDGSRFKSIILPGGGFRDMYPSNEMFICSDGNERNLNSLFMDGMGVFSFSITEVPQTIKEYLQYTNTSVSDYDLVALHQANGFIIKQITRRLKIPKEKVPVVLDRYGNLGAISIPLLMSERFGNENENKTLNVLMSGFGVGLSWGVASAIFQTKDILPIIETSDYFEEGKMTPEML